MRLSRISELFRPRLISSIYRSQRWRQCIDGDLRMEIQWLCHYSFSESNKWNKYNLKCIKFTKRKNSSILLRKIQLDNFKLRKITSITFTNYYFLGKKGKCHLMQELVPVYTSMYKKFITCKQRGSCLQQVPLWLWRPI